MRRQDKKKIFSSKTNLEFIQQNKLFYDFDLISTPEEKSFLESCSAQTWKKIASGMDHKTFQNGDLSQENIASAQRINSGHYDKCCSAAGSNPGVFGWIFWTLNWCLILVQMEQLGGLKRNFLPMGLHQLQMAPLVLDTSLLCFSPF